MIRLSLQLRSIKYFHDDVILTSALRSNICLKLTVADFPSDKYTLDCKYLSFCISLNTFKRLGIANSFTFIIFQCCYFYVMSKSTFPDQIRPRPLISCLNCAAYIVYITFGLKTIQVKWIFEFVFNSNAHTTPVRIYGEPYAHKFCAVDIFWKITCRRAISPVVKLHHVLGSGFYDSVADIDF